MQNFNQFIQDENGASAIEYTLVVALISITLIGLLDNIGDKTRTILNQIYNNLNNVSQGTPNWYQVGNNGFQRNTSNNQNGNGTTAVTLGGKTSDSNGNVTTAGN